MPHPLDEAHAKRRMELHERDAQAHRAMGETGRLSLLQRLADWRAQRKHDRLERNVRARKTSRTTSRRPEPRVAHPVWGACSRAPTPPASLVGRRRRRLVGGHAMKDGVRPAIRRWRERRRQRRLARIEEEIAARAARGDHGQQSGLEGGRARAGVTAAVSARAERGGAPRRQVASPRQDPHHKRARRRRRRAGRTPRAQASDPPRSPTAAPPVEARAGATPPRRAEPATPSQGCCRIPPKGGGFPGVRDAGLAGPGDALDEHARRRGCC